MISRAGVDWLPIAQQEVHWLRMECPGSTPAAGQCVVFPGLSSVTLEPVLSY